MSSQFQPSADTVLPQVRLETPESVTLRYELAGIGSRFLALLIDAVVIFACLIVLALCALALNIIAGASAALILLGTGYFLLVWCYFVLFEWLWHGRTPGKRVIGIRVVKMSGLPIGFVDSLIRNLVRYVDALPGTYTVGAITMFISSSSRRLGDYAAGTLVVRESLPVSLSSVSSQMKGLGAVPAMTGEAGWNIRVLSVDQIQALDSFLGRAPTFREDARLRLAAGLAAQIADSIGAPAQSEPEIFLRRVAHLLQPHSQ